MIKLFCLNCFLINQRVDIILILIFLKNWKLFRLYYLIVYFNYLVWNCGEKMVNKIIVD